jgi:hypothetical protein
MSVAGGPYHSVDSTRSLDQHGRLIVCAGLLLPTLGSMAAAAAARPELPRFMDAVVDLGSVIGLRGTLLWSLEPDYLRLIAVGGYADTEVARYAHLPLTASLPCADAVSERRAVICCDRDELFSRYPLTDRFVVKTQGLVSLPVIRRGTVVAGISFHFDAPVQIDDTALIFLQGITDIAAVLLDAEVRPLATVLPLTAVPSYDTDTHMHDADLDQFDEFDEEPASIANRLIALERQMRSMRHMMMFIGAIANDRFDEAP